MKWKDFKLNPPYDSVLDELHGYETDRTQAWFIHRYTHRPKTMNSGPFLSDGPREYYDGVFTGYKSQMKTSSYETDWIEVLYWIDKKEVHDMIMKDFKESHICQTS